MKYPEYEFLITHDYVKPDVPKTRRSVEREGKVPSFKSCTDRRLSIFRLTAIKLLLHQLTGRLRA